MLPFLIVSLLFIYFSLLCLWPGLDKDKHSPATVVSFWRHNDTFAVFLKAEALIYFFYFFFFLWRYWVCSAPFWMGPLYKLLTTVEWLLYPVGLFPSISPTWICPSNTKSNRCAYHNANWLEQLCLVGAEFWLWLCRPSWPFDWKLETCLHLPLSAQCGMINGWMMHLTACIWSSWDLFDQSENYLSQ